MAFWFSFFSYCLDHKRSSCSSAGSHYKVAWAGGEEESDDEECAITAVTRVDDPVASFDLCEEEDEATKSAVTAEAGVQKQQASPLPSANAAAHATNAAGALDNGEAQKAKRTALWESTKIHVDQTFKVQPDKKKMMLDLQVTEIGLCSKIIVRVCAEFRKIYNLWRIMNLEIHPVLYSAHCITPLYPLLISCFCRVRLVV